MPKKRIVPRFAVVKRPAKQARVEEPPTTLTDEEYMRTRSFEDRLKDFKAFAYTGKDTITKTPEMLSEALKTHFTQDEMRNWWNKLSRDRRDPAFAQNMDSVVKNSALTASKAKRGVLALRIADPTNFRELVGEQSHVVSHSDANMKGGQWMSRGQMHVSMGEDEAERKIAKGKFEVRWDSDSDSEFYVKFQKDKKTLAETSATGVCHRTEGKSEDYGALKKALHTKHAELLAREFGKNKLVEGESAGGNGPSVGSAETDAERVERLLQERKEQQKAEREKKKAEEEAERAAAAPQERAVGDAKGLEKSIPKAIDSLKVHSQKLRGIGHASSLVAAATALSKKLGDNLKQIQAALKNQNGKGLRTAVAQANKLLADQLNLEKPMKAMVK